MPSIKGSHQAMYRIALVVAVHVNLTATRALDQSLVGGNFGVSIMLVMFSILEALSQDASITCISR